MRTARQTILIAVVLALPYLVTGIISDGPHAGRLIQGGIVLLVIAGAAAAFMAWRGRRLDEAQDERQDFVVGKADASFSFCVMAVAVQAYWAWQFAAAGQRRRHARSGCWWRSGRPSAWATSTTRSGTDAWAGLNSNPTIEVDGSV